MVVLWCLLLQSAMPHKNANNISVVRERYQKLVELINYHRYHYHVLDTPMISDEAYDSLFVELLLIEQNHPELVSNVSPSTRIGDKPLRAFTKVKHRVLQWSFDNVFTKEELFLWGVRVRRYLKRETRFNEAQLSFVCEPKIDGLKIILTYEN